LDDHETGYELPFEKGAISFSAKNIHFEGADPILPYQNTLRFRLTVADDILLEREYYSIGGGFIQCKGDDEPDLPVSVEGLDYVFWARCLLGFFFLKWYVRAITIQRLSSGTGTLSSIRKRIARLPSYLNLSWYCSRNVATNDVWHLKYIA
jgi:hypothetical protein